MDQLKQDLRPLCPSKTISQLVKVASHDDNATSTSASGEQALRVIEGARRFGSDAIEDDHTALLPLRRVERINHEVAEIGDTDIANLE